jgi:endonuclease/exonuclease/phosphatase family metal-dependent hydrolase
MNDDLPRQLNILSYNIQTGLSQDSTHEYVTKGWRHLFPHHQRLENLQEISHLLKSFDIVALQEIDPGSLRSGYVNQIEYLAKHAHFPYWYSQINRNLGRIAKFCNAVLSRFKAFQVDYHRLPGVVPGRGAIRLFYGSKEDPLVVVIMHLSLGSFSQQLQMEYIKHLIAGYDHVVVMGDLNCSLEKLLKSPFLKDRSLRPANYLYPTYPSWKPRYIFDHILISPSIMVEKVSVLNLPHSDHLPISLSLRLS